MPKSPPTLPRASCRQAVAGGLPRQQDLHSPGALALPRGDDPARVPSR